jgi:TonB family protein
VTAISVKIADMSSKCWNLRLALGTAALLVVQSVAAQTIEQAGVTRLMRAVRNREVKDFTRLLNKGADLNAKDNYGWTPLMYAVVSGDLTISTELLDKGADVNARAVDGVTALMLSARFSGASMTRLLLERGADMAAKDDKGATALMSAAVRSKVETVKVLLDKGANVNDEDIKQATALTYALRGTNKDLADLIRSASGVGPDNTPAGSDEYKSPVPLNAPRPNYTDSARAHKIEGIVTVNLLVGTDGFVKRIRVLKGLPDGLSNEAVAAARLLRFKPALRDGQPAETWQIVEVEFSLGR